MMQRGNTREYIINIYVLVVLSGGHPVKVYVLVLLSGGCPVKLYRPIACKLANSYTFIYH